MSAFTKFITRKPPQQTGGITDIDTEFMLNSQFDPRIPGSNLVNAAGNFKDFLLDKSGLQQHFDENEVLRAAADRGQISNELYNKMGGFNFKENVPFAGDFGTGLGSFTYNVAQSVLGNQPISEIPGDVARNYMGAAAGLTKDEKDLYDSILGQRESTLTDSLVNIPSNIKNTLGDLIFTPTSADADKPPLNTGVAGINIDELDEDQSRLLDRKEGILSKFNPLKALGFLADLFTGGSLRQTLSKQGAKELFGMARDAVRDRLGPASYGTSQAAFNAMTPSQQQAVGSIYGRGGIMQGYNPISAFGRGPAGAIQNRIDAILGRKAAQTKASRERVRQLQQALTDVGGDSGNSGVSSGGYGGTGGEGPSAVGSSGMLGGGV